MTCEDCGGSGWFKQPNYHLEIMEWVECLPCAFHEKYLQDLAEEAAKLISRSSRERLAKILALYCVDNMENERLETMLKEKNFVGLMSFLEVNLKEK